MYTCGHIVQLPCMQIWNSKQLYGLREIKPGFKIADINFICLMSFTVEVTHN